MGRLSFNIVGLQEFIITFEDYCITCEFQRKCRYGSNAPFQVQLDCKEISEANDFKKNELMEKLGKKHPEWDWDKREEKAKVSKSQIFSKIWSDKVKSKKEDITCLNSRKVDSMLTSQRGEEWWSEFREVIAEIDKECSKIC